MDPETPYFSPEFNGLYCDATVFESFSALHPISFRRVLPFQYPEEGVDDPRLLWAEQALLAAPKDSTRLAVVDEYSRCGLLEPAEAESLRPVVDFYDADFFGLMGQCYANAGRPRCALRWYRERILGLETQHPDLSSNNESVYASVGYALYSLCLYEEAIAWSKACLGPVPAADSVCRALIEYEAQLSGGAIRSIERSGSRTRYTVSAFEPELAIQATPRLKAALKNLAPFHEVYIAWVAHDSPKPEILPGGYPFQSEYDGGNLVRHKMNFIFATCAHADVLAEKGYRFEAKRLLQEAAMLEPQAAMIADRLRGLP